MAAVDDPKTLGRTRLSFANEAEIDEFAATLDGLAVSVLPPQVVPHVPEVPDPRPVQRRAFRIRNQVGLGPVADDDRHRGVLVADLETQAFDEELQSVFQAVVKDLGD